MYINAQKCTLQYIVGQKCNIEYNTESWLELLLIKSCHVDITEIQFIRNTGNQIQNKNPVSGFQFYFRIL
jgi:hypothetical protein